MAAQGVSGPALAATAAGAVLVWSGLTGRRVTLVLRSLLSGRPPADVAADLARGDNGEPATGSWQQSGLPVQVGDAAGGGSPAANRALAQRMAAAYGWGSGPQWQALDNLGNAESGWSNTADTRQTGAGGDHPGSVTFAYGIAQARPATKMPKAAWPPDKGGQASAPAQIAWMLSYVKGRYGDPVAAWQFHLAHGWY